VLRSYRLGLAIVAATVLVAAGLTLGFVPSTPRFHRAGYDLGDGAFPLGHFSLTERSERTVTDADLAKEVWVASFIFTRCPSSCPRIVETLRGLRAGRLKNAPVRFVSISVDPDHDKPAVLAAFAKSRGLDGDRWWFLTGDKARIYDLILHEFHLPVGPGDGGPEAVAHSDRLALVDVGNKVVGFFSSDDPEAVAALVDQAKRRGGLAKPWVRALPAVNASLNATCGLLLSIGLAMILSGRWRAHAVCMISGTVIGVLFLGCYLVYHYHVGSVPFRGTGGARFAYFTILISHTALAALGVVPLAALTVTRALRRRFKDHARIARVTFPIWIYVSITGVVIYVMLYQLPIPALASGV
jgi:protein SCO1/2/putative membrane protein